MVTVHHVRSFSARDPQKQPSRIHIVIVDAGQQYRVERRWHTHEGKLQSAPIAVRQYTFETFAQALSCLEVDAASLRAEGYIPSLEPPPGTLFETAIRDATTHDDGSRTVFSAAGTASLGPTADRARNKQLHAQLRKIFRAPSTHILAHDRHLPIRVAKFGGAVATTTCDSLEKDILPAQKPLNEILRVIGGAHCHFAFYDSKLHRFAIVAGDTRTPEFVAAAQRHGLAVRDVRAPYAELHRDTIRRLIESTSLIEYYAVDLTQARDNHENARPHLLKVSTASLAGDFAFLDEDYA